MALAVAVAVMPGCYMLPSRPETVTAAKSLSNGMPVKKAVDDLAIPLVKEHYFTGIAVGVVSGEQSETFFYGKSSDDGSPVAGDTIFPVGSVSKVFLATMVAELVKRNMLSLNEPVHKLLPPGIKLPSAGLRNITVGGLVTHTSGLPQEAWALSTLYLAVRYLIRGKNLYEGITAEQMIGYLHDFNHQADREYDYTYSNLGYGLLGWLLNCYAEDKGWKNYAQMIRELLFVPLKMNDTEFKLSKDQKRRLAAGHAGKLPFLLPRNAPAEHWIITPALQAAGGAYSTMNDMMKFMKAYLGIVKTPLYPSMKFALRPRARAKRQDEAVAMGWYILNLPQSKARIKYINGVIGGYTSIMILDTEERLGVIVLLNNCTFHDSISFSLIDRLICAKRLLKAKGKKLNFSTDKQ